MSTSDEDMWSMESCPRCHSEDVEPVHAPSMYAGIDHGVRCHSCGRTSWLDPFTSKWPK